MPKKLFFSLMIVIFFTACSTTPEQAVKRLKRMKISYSEEGLKESIINQNRRAINLFIQSKKDVSPGLATAVITSQPKTLKKLLENQADPNYRDGWALFQAIERENLSMVKMLLDYGANPNSRTEIVLGGYISSEDNSKNQYSLGTISVLERAAVRNNLEIMQLLLERGAKANDETENNSKALFEAVGAGSIEAVKLLLKYGANPKSTGKVEMFPRLPGTLPGEYSYTINALEYAQENLLVGVYEDLSILFKAEENKKLKIRKSQIALLLEKAMK